MNKRDLERHVLEHEWKEKHSVIHHGYFIVLYVIIDLLCFMFPASCTMGTGSFLGVKCGQGVTLTPHPF
jgi:hypothetical protein